MNDLEGLKQTLEKLGVKISSQNFTADSAYPTEYYVEYCSIKGMGPTLEMALSDWIAQLLKVCEQPAEAYERLDASLKILTGQILLQGTDIAAIKAFLSESHQSS